MKLDEPPEEVQVSHEETVRLPSPLQPIASADVAQAVADVAIGGPLQNTRNIAGADVFSLDELDRRA